MRFDFFLVSLGQVIDLSLPEAQETFLEMCTDDAVSQMHNIKIKK